LIYWVQDRNPPQVAIVPRPRGDDWLADDLAALRADGIDVLVSFLEDEEAAELGLSEERKLAEQAGMEFISYPIPDRNVPEHLVSFRELVHRLADAVRAGKRVGAHCRACIGRSTVLIASLMIALGADPERALLQIERARGLPVPDTMEQQRWILNFRPMP
jgi:protein-tyrosine phosphatase